MKTKVKPRVRRVDDGSWLALVLIGEKHHGFGTYPSKREAKRVAREESSNIRSQRGE